MVWLHFKSVVRFNEYSLYNEQFVLLFLQYSTIVFIWCICWSWIFLNFIHNTISNIVNKFIKRPCRLSIGVSHGQQEQYDTDDIYIHNSSRLLVSKCKLTNTNPSNKLSIYMLNMLLMCALSPSCWCKILITFL